MTSTSTARCLLLATDLSARCDRALDRAAQLAQEWGDELVALNVLEPAGTCAQARAWAGGASDEELLHAARRQLARDLAAVNLAARMRIIRSGNVARTIVEAAAAEQAKLVITGVARHETLGQLLLGSTVEDLARSLTTSLLVVRNRPRGAYRRLVVATDFSPSSRQALSQAAEHFPGRELILYHAHAAPMAGLADREPPPASALAVAQARLGGFVAASPLPPATRLRPVIERGVVESALSQYVRQNDIELVVIGSHGESGIMSLLLGSSANKLLHWLPCDILLVPEPGARSRPGGRES